ncbi:MAG: HDOD domain-containing protein [Deltaproteobacteria bacterium]|nr:HDOD domain-containing protein [Deltaproteobacteria bacterium]
MATKEAHDLARLRAEIVNSKDVPTIPVLLLRILRVVDGERASAKDLVDLMQRDQALAGRVLRLANSGFFGCAREVSSLSRAVMLLGFSTVKNLALGIKIWETMASRGGPSITALWEHSALVGAAARAIAQRTRAADPEGVFTAGLLHDLGKVVLRIHFTTVYDAVAAVGGDTPLVVRERDAFGVDHARAGAWLGASWQLPEMIVDACRDHHDELAPATPLGASVVVNLANRLVHWTDMEQGVLAPEAEAVLGGLGGLSFGTCVEIAAQLQGQKDDLRVFYGAD